MNPVALRFAVLLSGIFAVIIYIYVGSQAVIMFFTGLTVLIMLSPKVQGIPIFGQLRLLIVMIVVFAGAMCAGLIG